MTRARPSRAFAISALVVIAAAAACSRSPTQPSSPVTPAAALTIRLADSCQTTAAFPREYVFEGSVVDEGFSMLFSLSSPWGPNSGDLRLVLTRVGAGMLSGQIALDRTGYILTFSTRQGQATVPVSVIQSASGFSGTFDAIVTYTHHIFSIAGRCDAGGFSYVLSASSATHSETE